MTVFEKKLANLKALGEKKRWTFHISEEGNYYIKNSYQTTITYDYYNVTKNLLKKLDTEKMVKVCQEIVMLTKTGKFLQKNKKTIGFKDLNRATYPTLWYIGRKSEWVLSKSAIFVNCRLATQFASFKEFKNFLGFDFIDEAKFELLCVKSLKLVMLYANRTKEERVSLVKLVEVVPPSDIVDVINMERALNVSVIIPAGKNSFRELHDDLMFEQNKLNSALLEVEVEIKNFDIPYAYEVIESSVRLEERGQTNRHCIGNYSRKLLRDLFLTIDNKYDCHIMKSDVWEIAQIRGFANSGAPQEMINTINRALKSATVTITNKTPEVVLDLLPF